MSKMEFTGPVPSKDMQTPPPPLRSGHIYMEDAHSAASNEKSYFRFSFFELWLIVFKTYDDTPGVPPTKKELYISGRIYRKDAH